MAVIRSMAVARGMLHVPVKPPDSLCPDLGCWAWGVWPGWGLGHLAAATGESPQLHERRQEEMAPRAKGFTKIPVSNLKAERREDAKDASRSSLSKSPFKMGRKYPGGSLGLESLRSCWRRFQRLS